MASHLAGDDLYSVSIQPDLQTLLRRYVSLQNAIKRLSEERYALKFQIAALLPSEGDDIDLPLDDELLHIRCHPKTSYKLDSAKLRERLGCEYYSILEPDTQRLKANMPEVLRLLSPIIHKVGIPSGERLDAAIHSGRIAPDLVADAITRTPDYSFAITHKALASPSIADLPSPVLRRAACGEGVEVAA